MTDVQHGNVLETEVETALLDADLFVKYGATGRAIKRLQTALERRPRSIHLRERLREISASHKQLEEAARQCLALASLYIEREEFDLAHDRLIEAKQLDPRISIAAGLEAIRRARRPDLKPAPASPAQARAFSGDLSIISIFDAVQVIENSKLTGSLVIASNVLSGSVLFNHGQIVGAEAAGARGEEAFRKIVEMTGGSFDFDKSEDAFPVTIHAASNTNLILDSLRQLDEESR